MQTNGCIGPVLGASSIGAKLETLVRLALVTEYSGEGRREFQEAISGIASVLEQGHPMLNQFRDKVISRFLGEFYGFLPNRGVSYFTSTSSNTEGARLVKTRVKTPLRIVGKARERAVQDIYGATIVCDTWEQIEREVRPYLFDTFSVADGCTKVYRNDAREPEGHPASVVYGEKPNSGYQAEHYIILFPSPNSQDRIPIDVHLQSMGAFLNAEFGKAALKRHALDTTVVFQLAKMLKLSDEKVADILEGGDADCIIGPSQRQVLTFGRGYASDTELVQERILEGYLPKFYEGIQRFTEGGVLDVGLPVLDSSQTKGIVADVLKDAGRCKHSLCTTYLQAVVGRLVEAAKTK